MDKENSKREVQKLIEKYDNVVKENRVNIYNEEMTKKDFILPLFRALGWNTEDSTEVTAEEKISKKRVDYGFRINGIPKFFLEAKKLKEDLLKTKFVEQAIDYSWNKGCSWAVLTNFETLAIFNAEWKSETPWHNRFRTITCNEFLDRFDELWLLSKDSFENNLIDREAEKVSKKVKKISVDKQLLYDFTRFRELLSKNITKLNQKENVSEYELDESVQRILDRLIFIRNCEDRELEPRILIANYREWDTKGKGQLIKSLRDTFKVFDKLYNSKIFAEHLCDSLDIDNDVLREIIEGLYYTKDKSVSYDFSAIDADILGTIYEQYLGHILKKTEKRATLTENHIHKKEQGIYYTPTYVVDYIVRSTLGELLRAKKVDVEEIRVLDPACGSGSFLIKAYDILNEYQSKNDTSYHQAELDFKTDTIFTKKAKILQNNIFGVDLDKQAVEIAQLNLLLKIAEKKKKLPLLEDNIKKGNSVIDEITIDNEAFNWGLEFKDIMAKGGFDIIISNPPYVDIKQLNPDIVKYFFTKYSTVENRMNLYSVFIERSIELLKEGGYLGFIIPNSLLYNSSYMKIRQFLLSNTNIKIIIRLPDNVFEEAKVETIILIIQKGKLDKNNKCKIYLYPRDFRIKQINEEDCPDIFTINQSEWLRDGIFNIAMNYDITNIIHKIEQNTDELINLCDFSLGLTPYDKYKGHTSKQIQEKVFHSDFKKDDTFKPLLSGENIIRYGVFWDQKEYISYGSWLGAPRDKRFFLEPRIIVRQIISGNPPRIYAGYSDEELYNTQIGFNLVLKNDQIISIKYILGILNSKLMSFYHKEKYLDPYKTLFQKILIANAKKFPIKIISNEKQKSFNENIDKIIELQKKYNLSKNKITDERNEIEQSTLEYDKKIDEMVYEIYELNSNEIKIIENNYKGNISKS
jgi:type I restriction-modification system DNA methylase subunit